MYWTYLCDISLYVPDFTDWSGSSYMNITRQLKLSRAFLEQRNVSHWRPFSSPLSPSLLFSRLVLPPPTVHCRLVPHFTPGEQKRTRPVLTLQEPATSQSRISPNLLSMLPVGQVTVSFLKISHLKQFFLSPCSSQNIITSSFCVLELSDAEGQGYCQGGFSADFTRVITIFLFVHNKILLFFCFHNLSVLTFRMAKWCWVGQAATFGKVC